MAEFTLAGTLEPQDPQRRRSFYTTTKIASASFEAGTGAARRLTDNAESCGPPTSEEDVTLRFQGVFVKPDTWRVGWPCFCDSFDPITLLRRGTVYVRTESPVKADDPVFCRFQPGLGGSVLGSFRADSDFGTAAPLPGRAKFISNTSKGHALLELNL